MSSLQKEEENANGQHNIGRGLAESHIPDRSTGHPPPDSSPPLASSSGARPETEAQCTAAQYSAEAYGNTAGQPAVSGPYAGQPTLLQQTSAHSTQQSIMMSPGPSAGDSKGIKTGDKQFGDYEAGQPAMRGPCAGQLTPLQQTSENSTQQSFMTSPGPSAGESKEIKTQEAKVGKVKGNKAYQQDGMYRSENDADEFMDTSDGSEVDHPSNTYFPQEQCQDLSETAPGILTLKFIAILRQGIRLEHQDFLFLAFENGPKIRMEMVGWHEGIGSVFSGSVSIFKEGGSPAYTYILSKNGKEEMEDVTTKAWYDFFKGFAYRRLFRNIEDTDKVLYQFDDICMKDPSWIGKTTKIDVVRFSFLKTAMLHLMNCSNADFPDLQNTLKCFESCLKRRVIYGPNWKDENILPHTPKNLTVALAIALEDAVQMQYIQSPIQKVLVAAVIAKQLGLHLNKNTIEHVSKIVKMNGNLQGTLTGLDDSVCACFASAVQYVVNMTKKLSPKSPKEVVWLAALFYAVCPTEYKQTLDISGLDYSSAKGDLVEIVATFSVKMGNQRAFASTILKTFSPRDGDPQVLSKLNLSPNDLLEQLLKWCGLHEFHTLHEVIEIITSMIKPWVESSLHSSVSLDKVKTDILSCLELMMKIIQKSNTRWTHHIKNVYSVLQLLNSFSGCLNCIEGDKHLQPLRKATLSDIIPRMITCIRKTLFGSQLALEDWTRLYEMTSDIWQDDWEKNLTELFIDKLQNESNFKIVELYAKSSHCPHAMHDCLSRHATKAIQMLYSKDNKRNMVLRNQQALGGLIKTVSTCQGYGKLMSLIIENISQDRKWHPNDYHYVLYDVQITELFETLALRQREEANYREHLSSKANEFIQDTFTFLDKLPEYIISKSISCQQMAVIIEKKKQPNTYAILMGQNMKPYHEALQEAEKDFRSFREMQCKMRALYNICQGSPVESLQLKSTMSLDLTTEKSGSLKDMMEKLSLKSEESEEFNIEMFDNIGVLSDSTYFKQIWRKIAKDVDLSEFEEVSLIPLNQVYSLIYQPAVEEFKHSHEMLMNLSMTLEDLVDKMGKFLKKEVHIMKELDHMNTFFREDSKPGWVENTLEHIKWYQELCSAVENAKVVNDLKDSLGLKGDFCAIGNLQVMSHTCLCDLTLEMHKAGETVKRFPPNVINFLKELSLCVEKGFISWIKEIIKDTGELSAFVELASISAGENALDIDKVCYFRDAISAAAPLIYGLTEKSGFTEFSDAVADVQSELQNDQTLEEKLRDSCKNRDWLEIAYETHGSVERSSLRQATDINENGIYTIRRPLGQTMVTLENCIALKCKEVGTDGNSKYRYYSLTELKELQNKLMLITVTHDNREDGITRYVEVLEHIINVGTSFLELCDAGHVLFKDWEMAAYCERERETKVWVNFGVTNVELKGQRPLLRELRELCDSMNCCLSEWLKYVETKRNKYYSLNCFTAKQLVNLCCSMADVQHKDKISASLLNMLSIMKDDITDEDVKDALKNALQTPVEDSGAQGSAHLKKFLHIYPDHIEYFIGFGLPEEVGKAGIMYCEWQAHEGGRSPEDIDEYRDFVMEHIDEHQDDDDWVREWSEKYEKAKDDVLDSQMKFKGGHSSDQLSSFAMTQDEISAMFENLIYTNEKIVMLWKTYHNKLSGLVSDKFVDLDVLGETIQHIANSATAIVQRKLPFGLEAGKPNLICSKYVEMAPLCLSVYKDEEQPLPSYDEILICTPETTAEEVELILRRALQSDSNHEKIYSLLNADKLNHEVSRKLESMFYKLSKTQDSTATENYRLIICCDLKASHSYVATAFDNYKRTLSENPHRNAEIKQYLKAQHELPPGAERGFGKLHCFHRFPQRTKLVFSEHAGMGKSLYVKSLVNAMKELKKEGFTHETIRLTESQLRPEHIIQEFQTYEDKPTDTVPRIFHFDVPPVVSKGLYSFLLQLFVLRCFQSPDGSMWRCNNSHVYLVEYTRRTSRECDRHNSEIPIKMEEAFLEMFPNVKCLSPAETQKYLSEGGSSDEEYQSMDQAEFSSEAFQRTYQYFKRYEQNQLENFSFECFSCEDTPKEWLQCLMRYCDNKTPSWGELRNFTHFLNMQLKKCEQSFFCSDILSQDLTGFKKFVVKFMITMSKDFSMRSLMISDESTEKEMNTGEDNDLQEFQLRRRWEQQAHPYIMFNADNNSMTFLGFHIHNLDAIDSRTGEIVEQKVIDRVLFHQLRTQRVPFNIDFERLPRKDQLDIISRVLGVINVIDPDDTYQLTLDNVMKILAIHLRFESDIPVIIMGETGCGKTRLVQFMCDLLRSGKKGQNMIVVRVHGGTTSETIYKKVKEAVEISKRNEALGMDTVLFFDEANTTEAVNAIKEVICDKSVNGQPIDARRLKIIAACNPYRKHSQEAIEQLEKAGLGYRVKSENTEEKLGQIPMRQLVYRVQPLPPSLSPLLWDFGKLNEKTQELYIQQMVKTFFRKENLPKEYESLFTKVISASQMYMADLTDECRMVSLRDIERCMKTVMWFYQQKVTLFPEMDKHSTNIGVHELVRSLILAIGVCYLASLENREDYLEKVAKELHLTSEAISTEIESCKKVFIDHVDCPDSVAKNDALKENVFMMVVCMNLRIPLFLVGKPGSSKSLSKTIAAHAMQGKSSQSELFKGFKKAQLASFQCSPHSSPDGIISVFRQCAQFQREKNLDEYVSVVVLDEIGLAEDSPKMPLKTLHPLLEFGCIDDEQPEDFKKVAFIGISNWSLDPAKMNRGILVLRTSPEFEELQNTALAICPHDEENILSEIEILIASLTEFYQKVLSEQEQFGEFFGLRDFYSLVKLIVSYAIEANGRPSNEKLTKAVQRNFGGFDSIDILQIFWEVFGQKTEKCDTISLLRENLTICTSGFTSRYLLLPTTNHAALQILKLQGIINEESTEVIFGSGFPHDEEYSQVCRTVNRVKTCMETGRAVILLNIQSLYESLYDALNQCYVKLGGSYYVDLGLGSHRVKCRVKDEFRLIVIEEKNTVYEQFPTPLLNRLEKHCLEISNIFPPYAKEMQNELENWLKTLVTTDMYQSEEVSDNSRKKHDCIIGYTEDTCASVLLHCCPDIVSRHYELHDSDRTDELDDSGRKYILDLAKEKLLQCATPDAVLKASKYPWPVQDTLLKVYFVKQPHGNMMKTLMEYREHREGLNLEVSTFSRLLNKRDLEQINNQLNIGENDSCLYLLNEFYTEQSFTQTLRDFLVADTGTRKLVLLQSYFECAKQSQRILFCVRHNITHLRSVMKETPAFDVVLITRLPRISGGCGYIASFGDDWKSLHLDELIPTSGFPGDIYQLQSMTVSEILRESSASCFVVNDSDGCEESTKREVALVDTVLLIKKSLQKGILQLQDKEDNAHRATKRIEILHGLLHNKYAVSEDFITILQRRIISILSAQEKGENWVTTQALSGHFVVEGGSFRHVLWVHLEDTVASALAQILAVIDGDNNLDNLINDPSPEMVDLWLKIFQEDQWDLLNIPATQSQGKVCVVSSTRLNNKSRSCLFPFGWVLKEKLHYLWSNLINLKGPCPYPPLEYLEKFEELIPLDWVKDIKGSSELFARFSEDLVNMTMTAYPNDLNKSFSNTLLELTPRLYHELTGKDPENVSLPWLFVAYQYMQDNHQHFYKLYLQNNDLVDAGEATEALKRTIESLQPKEDMMKDFAGCQDWIKKVKSLSMSVEVMLSENSLVTRLRENGMQVFTKIRLFWQSTRIMYLLMDHLLQNETDMEKKLLTLLVRNLIWMWKNLNTENGNNIEYVIEKVTGTLTKCGKNACNMFMVNCAYCDKEFTEDDTAKVECGHMFHLSCLTEHSDTNCRKCKKEISTDYKQCGVVDKETFLKVNRFRRKCSSFFVEFMWNFVPTKAKLTDKIVEELMNYVRGSPSAEDKKSEKSTLEECLKPDPATYSLVLKILLRCGMEESAAQLQKFMDAALCSCKDNTEELYFMIVRSIEDHIHSSNRGCLIQKTQECLSTCMLSGSDPDNITAEDLHTIAKLRFSISVTSDVICNVLAEREQVITDKGNEQLLQSLQKLISDSDNPWIQIYLLRNLCKINGFSIIHPLSERFKWAVPHGCFTEQDTSAEQIDPFFMYGDLYERIMLGTIDPSQHIAEGDRNSECFPVCMALAAVKQATQNRMLLGSEDSLIEKMKVEPDTDVRWGRLVRICERVTEGALAELSPGLSQIVLHTAVVVHQSQAPEIALLRTLCFRPKNAKDFYLPTMPSSVYEIMNWVKPTNENDKNTVWSCQCGEPVVIGDCGRPYVIEKCISCGQDVGGERHKPVEGFQKTENGEGSGRGHNLGDPENRKDQEGERNLFGAHLLLVRALIHSALIWGSVDHSEEIQNIIQFESTNVRAHLCCHLQKDIDLLASSLGKSIEDAETAVHLFLKHIMESKTVISLSTGDVEEEEDEQKGEKEEEVEQEGEETEVEEVEVEEEEEEEEMDRFEVELDEEEEEVQLYVDSDEEEEEVQIYVDSDEEEEEVQIYVDSDEEEEEVEFEVEEEEEEEQHDNLADADNRIATTETEEKRMDWETSIHQKLQTLFVDFEDHFSSMHNNILRKGGMNKLAQIVYSPVPELTDLPITGVCNLPLMWRFEQRMTIQLLKHLIEQKDEWKNLPVLTELLKNSIHIRYIRYLPQVLSLQHKLMHHFRNVDLQCYENVSIRTFIVENIQDDEVQVFNEHVDIVKKIWGHLTTIEYPKMSKDMMDKKAEDLMILDLLPRQKSAIYIVTDYLVRMQNDCINCANPKENRFIKTSEVKHSHVIDCTPEQDFLTIAMSNIDHVVCEDGTESTNYNFKTLERQIIDRFFTEKPIINVMTIPSFEYNTGTTLRAFFSTVKERLEPLNTNERNSILNDFRFLNEISAALSTLKIAIGFMQLSFPPPEEYLVTYLKKDLKLEDRTHTLSLPVLRTSRVKHIQSLWEVLSLRQSSLLIEMNQNPFFMIESGFHEAFSEDQRKEVTPKLANLTREDLFITELHYVIMNIHLKDVSPDWSLEETFDAFVDSGEIDENVKKSVESLELDLEMKNSIALWKMVVKMKRGLSG
ncbi:E3 ubiquitin-protein ligase rnf213-alpha-like isoform X2 [Sardina pilchardus]|uniref:E3 ubiquitin-protein ligase rnf213-alpha-like isoform X2 n=1 Tax=Sardina pilchardus TaxID=27697 RepID=UPI002E0FA820